MGTMILPNHMLQSTSKVKVNPERKRVRFSKEFKLEAVRLLELGQKPATQLVILVPESICFTTHPPVSARAIYQQRQYFSTSKKRTIGVGFAILFHQPHRPLSCPVSARVKGVVFEFNFQTDLPGYHESTDQTPSIPPKRSILHQYPLHGATREQPAIHRHRANRK